MRHPGFCGSQTRMIAPAEPLIVSHDYGHSGTRPNPLDAGRRSSKADRGDGTR